MSPRGVLVQGLGLGVFTFRDNTPIMENQMGKKMENEVETGCGGVYMVVSQN